MAGPILGKGEIMVNENSIFMNFGGAHKKNQNKQVERYVKMQDILGALKERKEGISNGLYEEVLFLKD